MATICIDAGGVLYYSNREKEDEAELERNPIDGARECLIKLKKAGHKLYLDSFAGRKTAALTKQDIERNFSGLFDGLFFSKNKLEKIAVCRYIGADVMIDDTEDVLYHIKNGVYNGKAKEIKGDPSILRILFNGAKKPLEEGNKPEDKSDGALPVNTWDDVWLQCEKAVNTHKADTSIVITKYIYSDI